MRRALLLLALAGCDVQQSYTTGGRSVQLQGEVYLKLNCTKLAELYWGDKLVYTLLPNEPQQVWFKWSVLDTERASLHFPYYDTTCTVEPSL